MDEFRFSNKDEQVKKTNSYMSLSMIIFDLLILLVVIISVIDGHRSLAYLIIMAGIMLATVITSMVMIKKEEASKSMRYAIFVGMLIVSCMIAFAYNGYYMRFMSVVPFLGAVLYFDKKY